MPFSLASRLICEVVKYLKLWCANFFPNKNGEKIAISSANHISGNTSMSPTFIRHIPIDSEWVEALVGLRLNVPNSWWLGFIDGGLNQGQIAGVNLDAPNAYYFEVELGGPAKNKKRKKS